MALISMRQLLEGRHLLQDFDVVYSTGLAETLPQASARALARSLFALLRPGGTLLLANFLPELPDAGLLEAILDWRPVLRTESEIFDLVKPFEPEAIENWTYSESPESTVGLLRVRRR